MYYIIDLILYKRTTLEINVYNALRVILGFICTILYIYQIKSINHSLSSQNFILKNIINMPGIYLWECEVIVVKDEILWLTLKTRCQNH